MRSYAMLGKWHVHAEGYAKELNALPGCRVAAVWDADGQADSWARALGCESRASEDILRDPAIEGVVICCATNAHTPLILRAVEAGKAVFTEKVLALTYEQAALVRQAIARRGTRFAISFPHLCEPGVLFALNAAKAGKLGDINFSRVRKAHNGATGDWLPPHFYDPQACGGGAMIDLGAHPLYLLGEILGEPLRARAAFTRVTGKAVEDNAVAVFTYNGGALGVAETSFVSSGYPFTMEIGGTRGTLLLRDGKVAWCCGETGGQWRQVTTLPDALSSPIALWAAARAPGDIPEGMNIEAALRLTRMAEMAYADAGQ